QRIFEFCWIQILQRFAWRPRRLDVTKLSLLQQIVRYFLDWNPKDAPIGAPALQNAGQLLIDNEVGAQEIDADQQQRANRELAMLVLISSFQTSLALIRSSNHSLKYLSKMPVPMAL